MNAPSAIFIIDDMSRFLHLKRHCLCAIWGVIFEKEGDFHYLAGLGVTG